jgi:hypothetical protein
MITTGLLIGRLRRRSSRFTTNASAGNYVQFPNGILVGDNSVTIEVWLTDNAGAIWAEPWCIGGSTIGPLGTLLQAPSVLGPWTTNDSAVSPYTVTANGAARFYKILLSP